MGVAVGVGVSVMVGEGVTVGVVKCVLVGNGWKGIGAWCWQWQSGDNGGADRVAGCQEQCNRDDTSSHGADCN